MEPSPRPVGATFPATPSRRRRSLVGLLVVATVLAGCGRGQDDTDPDAPQAGEPVTVTGRAGLVFHDVSTSGTLVFPSGSDGDLPVEADEAAISAAADAIRTWLDRVLTERNLGETSTVAASDVDVAAFSAALGLDGPVTDGLLETQVVAATYLIEVAHLGGPGWALARVESILAASSDPSLETGRRLDTFVFTIDESGALEFIALEVRP
jgi:hypothetical protein